MSDRNVTTIETVECDGCIIFKPLNVQIEAGEFVEWWNNTTDSHTFVLTNETGGVMWSRSVYPGHYWEQVFDEKGVYAYSCPDRMNCVFGRIDVMPVD